MPQSVDFVVYYAKKNKFGLNALLGAVDSVYEEERVAVFVEQGLDRLFARMDRLVAAGRRPIVAFSLCTPQIWQAAVEIRKIRKRYGDKVFCIAGGPHPTADPEGCLGIGFDIVARGEGEETILDILQRTLEDRTLADIQGVSYLNGEGEVINQEERKAIDLDKYPPFSAKRRFFGPIEIARGCPHACRFCQTSHIFGTRIRYRSVENVCLHVESMRRAGPKNFWAVTQDAFAYGSRDGMSVSLQQLESLLSSIREVFGKDGRVLYGSFPSEVRPENVTEETLWLVKKYADNDNIVIGGQSGSDKILERCNRGHSVADVYRSVELTRKAGLAANVDFIFGLPGETKEDVESTLRVIDDLVRLGARIHAHSFIPLPQTGFANEPVLPLNDLLTKKVLKLSSTGLAYGEWLRQRKDAEKIADYINKSM